MGQKKAMALALALGVAGGAAQAQEFSFEGNVSIVSDFIASGVTQTNGRPALQFTGTAYLGNFYAGIFASNVNFTQFDPADRDRLEVDLYFGYYHEFDNGIMIDLGYEHYFYNSSGACCGALYLGASTYIGEQFWVEALFKYDPRAKNLDSRATAMFYPTDSIGLRAVIGRSQSNEHTYMSIGADYYITDSITASLDFHRATSNWTRNRAVFGISYDF